MADAVTILSNGWSDSNSGAALGSRNATATTVNTAILAGRRSLKRQRGRHRIRRRA